MTTNFQIIMFFGGSISYFYFTTVLSYRLLISVSLYDYSHIWTIIISRVLIMDYVIVLFNSSD